MLARLGTLIIRCKFLQNSYCMVIIIALLDHLMEDLSSYFYVRFIGLHGLGLGMINAQRIPNSTDT